MVDFAVPDPIFASAHTHTSWLNKVHHKSTIRGKQFFQSPPSPPIVVLVVLLLVIILNTLCSTIIYEADL